MLLLLSQHIAQQLTPNDELCRWRGPCLMVVMKRHAAEAMVTAEMSRFVASRVETAMMFRDREVMVPLSVSWKLFPLNAIDNVADLVLQMNEFTGRRVLAAAM
jgi:hypothetical protein